MIPYFYFLKKKKKFPIFTIKKKKFTIKKK